MKTPITALTFTGGLLLGLTLAFCLGAAPKAKTTPTNQPPVTSNPAGAAASQDWGALKFFSYPNGGTGIFDPSTGTIYVYDSDLNRCYLVRELRNLGEPLRRP